VDRERGMEIERGGKEKAIEWEGVNSGNDTLVPAISITYYRES